MKRLLSLLLLLSAMQSVAAVPAAADVPAAANNVPAAGRADAILAGVSDGFRALGAYGVSFEVRSDEYVTRGRYAVEGENYYLVLGDAEVYCDGAVRYEVDNRRREVTIDVVDTGSRNILNNPVHAFDFLGSEYAASLAGGTDYSARYKLAPGLRVGDTRSLCESYVVDLRRRKPCDLLYPLHTFTTDSVAAPGIFELDVRRGIFRPLSSGSLPQPGDGWEAYELVPDGHSGMFWVMDTVRLSDDRGRSRAMPMRLVVDLGNANLLALFAFKPEVGKFVSRAPVDLVEGHTPGGMTLRVLMPAVATFMGCYSFGGLPVVVLDKPMKLPGDGFLGVKFFSAFRVVFDFRHGRLWLRLAD